MYPHTEKNLRSDSIDKLNEDEKIKLIQKVENVKKDLSQLNETVQVDIRYISFKDKGLVRVSPAVDKYDCIIKSQFGTETIM